MKVGDLVRCTETRRTGVLISLERSYDSTLALVNWGATSSWTDAVELESIQSTP